MDEYEHQTMKEKIAKRGKVLLWAGLVVTLIAAVLLIVGFTSSVAYAIIGGFTLVFGLTMVIFGIQMKLASKAGKITKYIAKETSHATRITTEAASDGIASGLKKHGMGIGKKEVVKVKCRNCGYLESEDAEFCSKCGQTL